MSVSREAIQSKSTVREISASSSSSHLQRRDDVLDFEAAHLGELRDANRLTVVAQDGQQHVRPVRAIRDHPEVGQRPLGRADLALALGERVPAILGKRQGSV